MNDLEKKRKAAESAIAMIEPGTKLGVGTGSTVNCLIELLPSVRSYIDTIVSSSKASTKLLEAEGFDVTTLNEAGEIDVYIDGADESNKRLQLIKGGGGAVTREKIIAGASRRFICIVDDSKLVGMLGSFPLPVEVVPMAQAHVARQLLKLRAQPVWREGFVTDNGNHILDVNDLAIPNPLEMETRLNQIPGIVTVGIFAHRAADVLLVASDDGVREMRAWMAFDLNQFVADCGDATKERAPTRAVRDLVDRAVSDPKALLATLGEPTRGEVQRLFVSDTLTVINVIWAPGMIIMPHNHNMWAVIGVYGGREDNIFWRRCKDEPNGLIEAAGAKSIGPGEVRPLGDDVIHSVSNPLAKFTAAIHVYGGDFFAEERSEWDPESLYEEPYDIDKNMALFEAANKSL